MSGRAIKASFHLPFYPFPEHSQVGWVERSETQHVHSGTGSEPVVIKANHRDDLTRLRRSNNLRLQRAHSSPKLFRVVRATPRRDFFKYVKMSRSSGRQVIDSLFLYEDLMIVWIILINAASSSLIPLGVNEYTTHLIDLRSKGTSSIV